MIKRPRWMRNILLVFWAAGLLLGACAAAEEIPAPGDDFPTRTPTATAQPTATATLTPTTTPQPTATLIPYPPAITADRLEKLRLLHRFDSLGFYNPENDWVVLYDNQQTAIWDLRSETLLATFIGRQRAVSGDYLLTASGGELLLWQVSSGDPVLSFTARQGQFHPENPWIVIWGTGTGAAQLWDYETGGLLGEFTEFPEDYFAFSPDGELLAASGGSEKQVRVWELPSQELLHQFEDHQMVFNRNIRVAFTEDGRFLIVSGSEENKIFDLDVGKLIWIDTNAWAVYPGLDSRYAFVTTDATTRVYDMEEGRYFNRYMLGDTPAFFPEENLITNHDANVVAYHLYIYEYGSFEQLSSIYISEGVFGNGSFYQEEALFVAVDQVGVIRFYDMNTWESIFRMEVPDAKSVYRPEFSREGHWLFFGWSAEGANDETFNVFEIWGIPE
jgi:WD40 repeat protein